MHYVYLIESTSTPRARYIGYTDDLKQRLPDHNSGKNVSTARRRPWRLKTYLFATAVMTLSSVVSISAEVPAFIVGEREVIATKEQRDALGLKCFMDGNVGVLTSGDEVQLYGANGREPVRVIGRRADPLQRVDRVSIATSNKDFQYLAGGPLFRDPQSSRIFLFYHAEIHRGTEKNFYSVLGLAIQTDEQGLKFKDLGPIFAANIPNANAKSAVEVCGSPYIIRDGYFYVYARDVMTDGTEGRLRQSNLSVARAEVEEAVRAGIAGKSAQWTKYYNGAFSEPAVGGKSSPLEAGNPGTRWMDISYNATLDKVIMVVAANTSAHDVELFITSSKDGIHWADRRRLAAENGEAFYPSIVGFLDDPRRTEKEFYVYYTFSAKGGWGRWNDAAIVRRKIVFADIRHNQTAQATARQLTDPGR